MRREYLLINDGLRPEGDIVCVALERLAVGHAEQQTGLGIVHGVVVDVHTVGNSCHALAVEYRLLVARDNLGDGHVVLPDPLGPAITISTGL